MTDDLQAPTPGLVPAFEMRIAHGERVIVGAIATGGVRTYLPVTGGTFTGEHLSGTMAGGSETLLERADGITMVEVSYYIHFVDGAVARCFGSGYATSSGTRLSLLFEASEASSIAALATRAFVAERAEGSDLLSISRIV